MIKKEDVYELIDGLIRDVQVSTDYLTASDRTTIDTLYWVRREIKRMKEEE